MRFKLRTIFVSITILAIIFIAVDQRRRFLAIQQIINTVAGLQTYDVVTVSNGHVSKFEYPEIDRILEQNRALLRTNRLLNWLLENCRADQDRIRRRCAHATKWIIKSDSNDNNKKVQELRIVLAKMSSDDSDINVRIEAMMNE